jgi:HPt (histidine-containing phosphotransfer) domain-containing protein
MVEGAQQHDVEVVREHIRNLLRDVNQVCTEVETGGLPDGTHALATALRSRLDDLVVAIDAVIAPGAAPARTGATAAPVAPGSAVDEAVLLGLLEDLGDPSRVSYLVQLFLTELHGRRQTLTTAVDQADVIAAKGVAHTLKSSALLLGATQLGHACDALVSNDSPGQLRPLVDVVLQQATSAARWFQIWLSNQPAHS